MHTGISPYSPSLQAGFACRPNWDASSLDLVHNYRNSRWRITLNSGEPAHKTQRLQELASEIARLQGEPDREIESRRRALGWHLKRGIVEFEHGITIEHRRLRMGMVTFLARSPIGAILTAPVIYSMFIPLLLMDAWASLYQAIYFRAYRIPRVQRARLDKFRERLRVEAAADTAPPVAPKTLPGSKDFLAAERCQPPQTFADVRAPACLVEHTS